MTVTEAIAEAGGVLGTGDKSKVVRVAASAERPTGADSGERLRIYKGNAPDTTYLVPGDQIIVPGNKMKKVQQILGMANVSASRASSACLVPIGPCSSSASKAVLLRPAVSSLSLLRAAFGQGAWAKQPAGSMAWLHGVFFIDQNRGWAAGSKGTLLHTEDGGRTWKPSASSTDDVVRDVFFVDQQNGWLVCEVNQYQLKTVDEPRAYLMRTTDGGANWTKSRSRGSRSIRFSCVQCLVAAGAAGRLVKRARSLRHAMPVKRGCVCARRRGGCCWAARFSTTIAVGSSARALRSFRLPTAATRGISRVCLGVEKTVRFNASVFLRQPCRLGRWQRRQRLFARRMAAARGERQESGVNVDLFDVKFVDAQEGWAVGAEGTIVHTTNGGGTWTSERSGTEHQLERVFFTDKSHGWAVGFGGTVVAYLNK